MTRKLSITTAVAVVALSIGAPAAFGEGRLAGSVEPVLAQPDPMIEDGFAQAVAAKQAMSVGTYRDANERGSAIVAQEKKALHARSVGLNKQYGLGEFAPTSNVTEYRDSFERSAIHNQAVVSQEMKALEARSEGLNKLYGLGEFSTSSVTNYKDAFERAVPPQGTVTVSAPSSGTEIDWPQVGVGLGIGLLLALGLGLIIRVVHIRPFAH